MSYWSRSTDLHDSGVWSEDLTILRSLQGALAAENIDQFKMSCAATSNIYKDPYIDSESATNRGKNFQYTKLNYVIENGGRVDHVKVAIEEGCLYDVESCILSVEHNNLDVLKYLRDIGCPWDDRVCAVAILYDNLPCLKYCLDNGCPLTFDAFSMCMHSFRLAHYNGKPAQQNYNTLIYLLENKLNPVIPNNYIYINESAKTILQKYGIFIPENRSL